MTEYKIFETPEDFFKQIPTDLQENIQFRIDLHKMLCDDVKLQQIFLEMCRQYKPILFNTTLWTFNPKKRINSPFNLRPHQIPAVVTLDQCIQEGHDVGINKSREEGASEICCKLFAANCLLYEYNNFIVGSRKEDLVDHAGDPTTLFAKVDNVFDCLPSWWKKLCGYNPSAHRKNLILEIPMMNSSIVGETTNESFSAGSRATAMLLDEFGRVDASIAESIEGSVHDVTDCVIYSSTRWLGQNHPFSKALKKESTNVIELMWYDNPVKNKGLYTSPEPGKIEILDKEHYKDKDLDSAIYCSSVTHYKLNSPVIQFIADGGLGLPPKVRNVRSPWHDVEEKKRKGNKRDFVCNVWACDLGASDSLFDVNILERIKEQDIIPPVYEGEIEFDMDSHDTIDKNSITLFIGQGEQRLKWWGELHFGRPNQRHNYIIGIDPSYGLGSANSAAIIVDVNLREQVGSWVDSNTKPEDFADIIVALAYWIGGVDDPFLIWESNAGCGQNFTNRVVYHGYFNAYTQRREDSKTRKQVKKWGWASNEKAKENLLGNLGVALSGGLAGDKDYLSLTIHDEELLKELADYIFKEGKGIVASSKADLSTGAMERHGDRGIAAGLCVLGMKEQIPGDVKNIRKAPEGSFEYYRQEHERQQAKDKRNHRRFWYD